MKDKKELLKVRDIVGDSAGAFEVQEHTSTRVVKSIDTGGGAYIEGAVTVGGDFVGRDKITWGDEVHGDKIGEDQITVGDISGSQGVAIGRDARATVSTGVGGSELAKLFASVYESIKDRPDNPDVDKEEIEEAVKKVEEETAKGEEANPIKVNRWLKLLADAAPDVVSKVANILMNPALAVAAEVRGIAKTFA
jgi:hypothetical protein